MRLHLFKSSCLLAVVAALLFLAATPGMVMAAPEPVPDFDANPCQGETSVPRCCFTADCPLTNCFLESTVTREVLTPGQPARNEIVCLAWSPADPAAETSTDSKGPPQYDTVQKVPSCPGSAYYCRNCLGSEEPPLV